MAQKSNIQWTDATWNIARGCTKVDEDCKNCYMYRDSFNNTRYNPFHVVKTKTVFDFPLKYKETKSSVWGGKPLIFASSLTDFYHEECDSYRNEAWEIVKKCSHLIFQIPTKRPGRIFEHTPIELLNASNVWLGTSIGSEKAIHRLYELITPITHGIRFLSLEPLHGPITLPLDEFIDYGHKVKDLIDWVIVGGESGNETGKSRYRPCEVEWIENIVNQCKQAQIPVFVKQLGTHLAKKLKLKDRHGGNIDEFPDHLKIREFPKRFH